MRVSAGLPSPVGVDKFDPVTSNDARKLGEPIVSRGDSTVDLEVAEHMFDAIALAIEVLETAGITPADVSE